MNLKVFDELVEEKLTDQDIGKEGITKSKVEKGNQPTPQIMAADDILQLAEDNANKDAYELNGTFYANFLKQKFIQLSSVESALKEIDENSLKTEKEIFDLVWDLVPETDDYERLEVEQDLIKRAIYETIYLINQIITKSFRKLGVEVE